MIKIEYPMINKDGTKDFKRVRHYSDSNKLIRKCIHNIGLNGEDGYSDEIYEEAIDLYNPDDKIFYVECGSEEEKAIIGDEGGNLNVN